MKDKPDIFRFTP